MLTNRCGERERLCLCITRLVGSNLWPRGGCNVLVELGHRLATIRRHPSFSLAVWEMDSNGFSLSFRIAFTALRGFTFAPLHARFSLSHLRVVTARIGLILRWFLPRCLGLTLFCEFKLLRDLLWIVLHRCPRCLLRWRLSDWCFHLCLQWCPQGTLSVRKIIVFEIRSLARSILLMRWWIEGSWSVTGSDLESPVTWLLWDAARGQPLVSVLRDLFLLLEHDFVQLFRALLLVNRLKRLSTKPRRRERSLRTMLFNLYWSILISLMMLLWILALIVCTSVYSVATSRLVSTLTFTSMPWRRDAKSGARLFETPWGWIYALVGIIILGYWRFGREAW